MADSEALRTEITELTDTAVELGLAVAPVTPRPELRASVLAAIENTPQSAPAQSAPSQSALSTGEIATRRHALPAEVRAASRWSRVGIVLASAAAVAALVVGGIAVTHFTNPMTVLANAEDSEQVTAQVEGGGTATVMWSESVGQAAVIVHGLSQLPADFVYQLWYMGDDIRPAGTFTGDASVVLAGAMQAGDQIGISIEPAGGSAQPTSDPILAVQT